MSSLSSVTHAFLLVFAGLFPIVNPVGNAPIFLRLTQGADDKRQALARAVSINGFFLLLGSLFIGSHVLEFFGITLPIVRIAGGMVVAAFGWNLLHSDDEKSQAQRSASDNEPGQSIDAFYPLTMPLTVGPGSISVAVTLGSQRPATDYAQFALVAGGAIAGLLAVAITIYVSYAFAERIVRRLGERGTTIVMRLSAFILFCLGIQIIWNGYNSLMALPA
ncbi:MAG: NAAT family transporter [Bradyrhizobiaceae bacterium]|nr:MAG: NAAT family transporter [Bradyrhizobiaceae bacterium]